MTTFCNECYLCWDKLVLIVFFQIGVSIVLSVEDIDFAVWCVIYVRMVD